VTVVRLATDPVKVPEILDKDADLGPLIQLRLASTDQPTTGLVDALIWGF
jgi:hypothetical protein